MENFPIDLTQLSHWEIDLLTLGILLLSPIIALIPEEAILLALGTLIFQGRVSPVEAFFFFQAGVLIADFILLNFGRFAHHGMSRFKFFEKLVGHPTTILATRMIRNHAKALIFLTRFTPTVRSPIYIAAGISHVPFRTFVLTDFFASLFHIPLLLGIGYTVAQQSSSTEETLKSLAIVFAILFGFGFTISLVLKKRASHRRKSPAPEPAAHVKIDP